MPTINGGQSNRLCFILLFFARFFFPVVGLAVFRAGLLTRDLGLGPTFKTKRPDGWHGICKCSLTSTTRRVLFSTKKREPIDRKMSTDSRQTEPKIPMETNAGNNERLEQFDLKGTHTIRS